MVVAELVEEDAARERVAVRVQADRGQADQDVALAHGLAVDEILRVDDAEDEAGDVVVVVAVEARHLRGLAADQRAAVLLARAGHAADHVGHHRRAELAGGVVVEEEQRTRALHEDVVDAVRDEVVADRVVDLHRLRHAQLRPDAVGGGDEDRRLDAFERAAEEASERADVGEDAGRVGVAGDAPDFAQRLVLRVDVDAGVFVGGHGRSLSERSESSQWQRSRP